MEQFCKSKEVNYSNAKIAVTVDAIDLSNESESSLKTFLILRKMRS